MIIPIFANELILIKPMHNPFSVIFYGTPEFAVPSLEAILKAGFAVPLVVTTPDKPAGRGLEMKRSAIGQFADKHNIPVLTPEKLDEGNFISSLQQINPALQVVVAFRKLPEKVWSLPSIGTINLHASLLPQYRGAAPINWSIINGENETGITTFFISDKIDTGDIIMQQSISIKDTDNAGIVHDQLSELGAGLLVKTIQSICDGSFPRIAQHYNNEIKKAPKLSKDICRINWSIELTGLYNFIRGLSPYPAAWTTLIGKVLKIYSTLKIPADHAFGTGTVVTDFKSYFQIAVSGGFLSILELQLEGRNKLPITEFLKGIPKTSSTHYSII
jgi:methionyl-tRNA formyltransferase